MANAGPNSNSSQYVHMHGNSFAFFILTLPHLRFFITFVATPHLDGRDVVFGEVADDKSKAIIKKIESKADPERPSGATFGRIFIEKAGELTP